MNKKKKINSKKKRKSIQKKSKKKIGGMEAAEARIPSGYFDHNNSYRKKKISGKVKESYDKDKEVYTYSYSRKGKDCRAIFGWNIDRERIAEFKAMYDIFPAFNSNDFNNFLYDRNLAGRIELNDPDTAAIVITEDFTKNELFIYIEQDLQNKLEILRGIGDSLIEQTFLDKGVDFKNFIYNFLIIQYRNLEKYFDKILKDSIQYKIDKSNPLIISIYCTNFYGAPQFQDFHADSEGIRINTYIDTSDRNSVDFVLNRQSWMRGVNKNFFETTKDKFISLDTNKNNTICWDDRYVLHRGAPYYGNRGNFKRFILCMGIQGNIINSNDDKIIFDTGFNRDRTFNENNEIYRLDEDNIEVEQVNREAPNNYLEGISWHN